MEQHLDFFSNIQTHHVYFYVQWRENIFCHTVCLNKIYASQRLITLHLFEHKLAFNLVHKYIERLDTTWAQDVVLFLNVIKLVRIQLCQKLPPILRLDKKDMHVFCIYHINMIISELQPFHYITTSHFILHDGYIVKTSGWIFYDSQCIVSHVFLKTMNLCMK